MKWMKAYLIGSGIAGILGSLYCFWLSKEF